MSDVFDAEEWPEWQVAVAIRVDELVAKPDTMERFRQMLCDWKTEHDARGPKSFVDKRGHSLYNPVEILPRRRLRLTEKYAAVAAIHDVICEKAKRIDPWTTHKRLRDTGFPKATAGMAYTALCRQVGDLGDAQRKRIEGALRDVEADLAPTQASAGEGTLIDRLVKASDPPRLSADELARLRAYLKAPLRLSELQRDPAERERRRKLQEILNYNDELRRTGAGDNRPLARDRQWKPPRGYVGTKTICHDVRFRKSDKNPQSSTIQRWVERAVREDKPVEIVKAPDTGENFYPEAWIAKQIERWSPRSGPSSVPAE